MKGKFVLIFRQGTRKLSADEQKARTEAVRNWALEQVKQHNLDPRILIDDIHQLGDGVNGDPQDRTVIALNFIEAADFNEAMRIAESHPGLQYGVGIEVRPWFDPRTSNAGLQP